MVIVYTSLQYPLHYLPDHRLLCVLCGKQKAPGMNLHNRLASINWRFNYFSKFNPGAEALRIDISVLTHYRHVTNQIFSFAFPVRYDLSGKPSLSRASGIRRIQAGRLHGRCFHIHYSLQTYQRLLLLREFRFDNFILPCFYNRFQ